MLFAGLPGRVWAYLWSIGLEPHCRCCGECNCCYCESPCCESGRACRYVWEKPMEDEP